MSLQHDIKPAGICPSVNNTAVFTSAVRALNCTRRRRNEAVSKRPLNDEKSETASAWIFVGFGLVTIGAWLYAFGVTEDGSLARFLAVMGFVYFNIGLILSVMHGRHMDKRTRAGTRGR